MAFPLMAIGAGLGLGIQEIEQQKYRQQQLALQQFQAYRDTMMLRNALQKQQSEQDVAALAGLGLPGMGGVSGGLPGGTVANLSGGGGFGLPGGTPSVPPMTPSGPEGSTMGQGFGAPALLDTGSGSGGREGAAPQDRMPPTAATLFGGAVPQMDSTLNLIEQDESGGRNIPNYRYDPTHTAQGNFQITNSTWRDTAPNAGVNLSQYPTAMSAPYPVQRQVAGELLNERGTQPWADFNPQLKRDLAKRGGTQVAQADTGEMSDAGPQGGGLPAMPVPPNFTQIYRETQQAAQGLGHPVMPQAIAQAAMARYKQAQQDYRDQIQQWNYQREQFNADRTSRRMEQAATARGAKYYPTADGGLIEVTPDGKAKPVQLPEGTKLRGERGAIDGLESSKTLQILDSKGNVVRTVMARERRNAAGWLDSQTGEPIKLEKGQQIRQVTPGSATGGRAGAQVLRQEIGGREVLSDLQNAVKLPVGTTIGPLGTSVPGTSVMGALQGDLVRKLTDQDSQLMQASMASMTRELSILMSPVYGGNYAAQQIEPLVPKSGDTIATVLFKLARLGQSADNALEAVSKSPLLSNDQQEYARDLRTQIQQAIPWSSEQALAFAQGPNPGESFGDFMRGHTGSQQQGQGGGAPAPPAAAIADLKAQDTPKRRQQFDEIFGPGAAAKALGQ